MIIPCKFPADSIIYGIMRGIFRGYERHQNACDGIDSAFWVGLWIQMLAVDFRAGIEAMTFHEFSTGFGSTTCMTPGDDHSDTQTCVLEYYFVHS